MKSDLDFLLAGDDVVIGHDMALVSHNDAGALALGGIAPDAHAPPHVIQLLGAHPFRIDAHHRGHHRAGDFGVFGIQSGEQLDIAQFQGCLCGRNRPLSGRN
jgi:hypothetical protein